MIKFANYVLIVLISLSLSSCSSTKYKIKKSGKHQTQQIYKKSYEDVWNTIYDSIAVQADIEIALETEGFIRTGWNYSKSDIHYVEYEIDGQKKTQPLRIRFRYLVTLQKEEQGIKLKIESEQEYEEFDPESPNERTGSWIATTSAAKKEVELLKSFDAALAK